MIRTIIVDDELLTLDALNEMAMEQPDFQVVGKFTNPLETLVFAQKCAARKEPIGFALLDVEMPVMNGIELGEKLKALHPQIILIYVTAHDQYALQAYRLKADYFIMKPFTQHDIEDAFERALLLSARQDKRVMITAFGSFEVFLNSKRVSFGNAKAKELLALCVDRRGAEVSINDAVHTLWEDRPDDAQTKKLYRKAVIYLDKLFEESSVADVFAHARGTCWINPSRVRCDYYDYLNGDETLFKGKYMTQYSWGEETLAELTELGIKV